MPLFDKHFTVEEANQLVPELQSLFAEIHAEIARLDADDGALPKTLAAVPTNGGGKKLEEFFQTSETIRDRLARVDEMGVQVKEVRLGLLDFPSYRNGEEVLLCWLVEEPAVQFWHDLEHGFQSRQRI